MNNKQPPPSDQNLNISDSVLENVEIGGIAGRDLNLTQIQGEVETVNVFSPVQLDKTPISIVQTIDQKEYQWRQFFLNQIKREVEKSLKIQASTEVRLVERNDLVYNPLSTVEEFSLDSGQAFPVGTTSADIFEELGVGRTLLLLGVSNIEKTVTLLKLLESLIIHMENDLSRPFPAVVNLASWTGHRRPIQFADWLIQKLHEIYGVPKTLGQSLIDQEKLTLVLDGLDEVKANYRNSCVKALNQFVQTHGLTEMVVCSRLQEYQSLCEYLKLHKAICAQSQITQ